jgi:hypothetical protein
MVEYGRSTGGVSGTVDLMLTFIEAGTQQVADLGYGDETYFDTLRRAAEPAGRRGEGVRLRGSKQLAVFGLRALVASSEDSQH